MLQVLLTLPWYISSSGADKVGTPFSMTLKSLASASVSRRPSSSQCLKSVA